MINELQASLDQSFPEFVSQNADGTEIKRVLAFNRIAFAQNPQAELERCERELGLEKGALFEQIEGLNPGSELPFGPDDGKAYPLVRADGSRVTLAFGTGDPNKLSAGDIIENAWNTCHEIAHGVYPLLYPEAEISRQEFNALQASVREQLKAQNIDDAALASMSKPDLLIALGAQNSHELLETLRKQQNDETFAEVFSRSLMVHNGADRGYWWDRAMSKSYDARQVGGFDPYDPSEEAKFIQQNHPDFLESEMDEIENYQFSGMREAAALANEAVNANTAANLSEFYEQYIQAEVNGKVYVDKIIWDGTITPKDWLSERSHIIRDAQQAVAGMKGFIDTYETPEPGVTSLEQAAGRAFLQFQKTKSEADKAIATGLLRATFALDNLSFRPDFNLESNDVDKLMLTTEKFAWADQLANGEPIEQVSSQIQNVIQSNAPQGSSKTR